MATAYLTSSQLNYFDNVIITSIQQLKRWKKGTHLDNIYKEVIKTSDFVSVPIQYLSNRLLTLVQEGKVNNKLYRNTVTYLINPEILCATKKSLASTPKTLDCETPVNINSNQLASPPSTPTANTPNTVNKNAQEPSFTKSARSSPLTAPVVTAKNTNFHAVYLALKDFFINEICVLRNELISNKQYVDQVLADANISSQTSKLNAKIELLEKENMELRRIFINKEIIIQKLSANKNITKEIPKNEKADCSTNKDEEYSFCEIVTECPNPPNENIHHKNDSNQIDKNENNINKQLTEIRLNKHKNYLQSKNLEINKNQSNKEECQEVHQWPKGTVAIIGDSMVSGLKEELLSNKKHQLKVRCCRCATVEDMFDYIKPILKRKPDYVVLHVGINNAKDMSSKIILDKLQLKTAALDYNENCKIVLSQPMTRVDDGKACLTISKLNDLLEELDIPIVIK